MGLQTWRPTGIHTGSAAIFSDSMSALQEPRIQDTGTKSGPETIHAILRAAKNTGAHGIAIRLQCIPGYCEAPDDDAADRLAKKPPFFFSVVQREGHHWERVVSAHKEFRLGMYNDRKIVGPRKQHQGTRSVFFYTVSDYSVSTV